MVKAEIFVVGEGHKYFLGIKKFDICIWMAYHNILWNKYYYFRVKILSGKESLYFFNFIFFFRIGSVNVKFCRVFIFGDQLPIFETNYKHACQDIS